MREVLRAARERDAQTARYLDVIDRFDASLAADASVEQLAQIAYETSGLTVIVCDDWSGVNLEISRGETRPGGHVARAASGAVYTRGLRGRNSIVVELPRRSAITASVEGASGRFGFVAIVASKRHQWSPLDHLVVERLAVAVAARALRVRDDRLREDLAATVAIERLLAGGLTEYELAAAVRQMRMPSTGRYVVAALEQTPRNAVAPEALAAIAERAVRQSTSMVRVASIGRLVGVVAAESPGLVDALAGVAQRDAHPGFHVHVGIGEPVHLGELSRSWAEAQEALALRSVVRSSSPVSRFQDLGVVHLLAQIPEDAILQSNVFRKLVDPKMQRGAPPDIDVLEAYLEEGSLRRAAARVFLHHTSIKHRVRRIEAQMALDLARPADRFQAQLALNLYRVLEARDASREP